jgi:hypothetical protein
MMAAKGLVPVKGGDLVTVLAQLGADADAAVAAAASSTLDKMPENVLIPGIETPLHPAILDSLAERFTALEIRAAIVRNPATAGGTLAHLARIADEALTERIALNETRLLDTPAIIEALYRNKNTRMSTADRIVDLAARAGIEVESIPSFQDHVEALKGELIPEATDEPLPSDASFTEAIASDDDDPDVHDKVDEEGTEEVKKKHLPLQMAIAQMTKAEKLRFATIGSAAARAILMRDRNRAVAMAAIQSPQVTVDEATAAASSKDIPEDVLRFIGNRKEWARSYELKRALCFNSKAPIGITMKLVSLLNDGDVKVLAKSKNVPQAIRAIATQRVVKKVGGQGQK